jgi:subtilase family serine protease
MYQEKTAMYSSAHFARVRTIWLSLVVLTLAICAAQPATAATGQAIAHNTPRYVATSKKLAAENPAKSIEVSVWLNLHNRAVLDALAEQLYDRTSPSYHHWLKPADLARFAPTAEEARTVQKFLEAHNLRTVRVGPNNFFVRARGTVGDVQTAFHVQLNKYQVRGKVIRSNDRDPYVEGEAAPLVRSVSGLDSGEYEHPVMSRTSTLPASRKGAAGFKQAAVNPNFYGSNCFDGTEKETFVTSPGGPLPTGTYSGNHLNLQSLTSDGCGYTPAPIQTAYNLTGLYAEGYTGKGQTIGIIDWCGSLTIQNDANAFSAQFGLPALTSSNFAITYIPTPSNCEATDQVEINLDVEWAHAIAPGANINLIVPPSASFQDVDQAEFTAVNYGLANVISGSYGSVESFTPTSVLETENMISEIAAISGISTNFATGDSGDFTAEGIPPTVLAPADSPWATGVGGVTLALNADNSIAWQAGWGNNQTLLAEEGFIEDPVYFGDFGFIGGAGGGPSTCVTADASGNCLAGFPKPWFQKKLAGKYRQLPDVSWLADPYTGAVIAISIPGQSPELVWQVWGGTSLATPMFSGLWAIANQEAQANGGAPLGQAAPYLYSLPADAIFDILPVGSKTNVTATIVDSAGTTKYTAAQVLGGPTPDAPGKFVSAIWDYPAFQDTALVISFGTDCAVASPDFFADGTVCNVSSSLHTKIGWDNVTGVGTPNGQAFADAFNPSAAAAK